MESIICLFQKCNSTITAMLMASGKAWNSLNIDTSLSDYLITDFWVKSMIERYNE